MNHDEFPIPGWLAAAFALAVGAAVGSFLNVVVSRLPAEESVVRPRSRCPACRTPIAWFDNLPVVSWLLLGGRCRACAGAISIRYPLVELAGAGLSWLAWSRHGLGAAALAEFGLAAGLLTLALIDLDTWLLPHVITWPLLATGLGLAPLGVTLAGALEPALWGAGIGYLSFALVHHVGSWLFRREALGGGDVVLLGGIGAWLGLRALLPVVLLASLQGTAIGIALAALGKLPKGEPPAIQPGPADPATQPLEAAVGEEAPGGVVAAPQTPGSPAGQLPAPGASPGEPASPPAEPESGREEQEWVPPRNAIPFGPLLALGALEWLYLAGPLSRLIPQLGLFR